MILAAPGPHNQHFIHNFACRGANNDRNVNNKQTKK